MDVILEVTQNCDTTTNTTLIETIDQINNEVLTAPVKKKKKKHWGQRDSLARRNKLLVGKEGSRRRQRWNNNQFNDHPYAVLYEDDLCIPGYPQVDAFWTHPDVILLMDESDYYDENGDFIMNELDLYISSSSPSNLKDNNHINIPHHVRQDLKKQHIPQGVVFHYEQQLINFINNYDNHHESSDLIWSMDNSYIRFLLHQMSRYYQLESYSEKNQDECYIFISLPSSLQEYQFPDRSFFDYLFTSL
ncbi:hypothetical protein BJ944DRAFT_272017 [Cunninghamella echinulata]|nr:hypothetical protein BJ944DRAFT_272017 [Cunninghamella echinulata]